MKRSREFYDRSGLFDSNWYLMIYPDVASKMDPFAHYITYGWRESRVPSAWFNHEILQDLGFNIPVVANLIHEFEGLSLANQNYVLGYINQVKSQKNGYIDYGGRLLDGICLLGYLTSEIGLGQAARNIAYAMDATQIQSTFYDLKLPGRSNDREFASKCSLTMEMRTNLLVTGLPSIGEFEFLNDGGRNRILYPFWELAKIPEKYGQYLESYSAVFAPCKFIAESLERYLKREIPVIPLPVRIPAIVSARPLDSILRILFFFDYDSFPERKNPIAALKAFKLAFENAGENVELIIKTRGNDDKGFRKILWEHAKLDSRIKILDKVFSRHEIDRLVMDSDVFISLHRSEGFGFGPAEALAAGKIVVATNYSGSTDFISEHTAFPVDFTLVEVGPLEYVDWVDQLWAEPNIDHAAKILRYIYENREVARERAKRGRLLMKDNYSSRAVGIELRKILTRLDYI